MPLNYKALLTKVGKDFKTSEIMIAFYFLYNQMKWSIGLETQVDS